MDFLPPELLQIICGYLQPVPHLLRLQCVSRKFLRHASTPSLWKLVHIPVECFPSNATRRTAWNKFSKRIGKNIDELHLTLPRVLRLAEHHHPLTHVVRDHQATPFVCSVCQQIVEDESFFSCKIPTCLWIECVACRKEASLPLSLSSFSSLQVLHVRDESFIFCFFNLMVFFPLPSSL